MMRCTWELPFRKRDTLNVACRPETLKYVSVTDDFELTMGPPRRAPYAATALVSTEFRSWNCGGIAPGTCPLSDGMHPSNNTAAERKNRVWNISVNFRLFKWR